MRDLTIPLHVASLHDNGTLRAIPYDAGPLVIEIGVSDRNTADRDLLPMLPSSAFLVSCEPLIDKYARGLARLEHRGGDLFQPLGMHHTRGIILPVAVGPVVSAAGERDGEARTFHVAKNAGCSSLDNASNTKEKVRFGAQCGALSHEKRRAWVVTLRTLLAWVGPERPIDLIKVDVQGPDMDVIESGGELLHRVQRFVLEIVADDCAPNYANQRSCSQVVAAAASLGFEPALPLACRFPDGWKLHPSWRNDRIARGGEYVRHSFCEMDVLFVRRGVDPFGTRGDGDAYRPFHMPGPHACTELYASTPETKAWRITRRPPPGTIMVVVNSKRGQMYLGDVYEGNASAFILNAHVSRLVGRRVLCPADCFASESADTVAALGPERAANVSRYGGRCAW